MRSTQSAWYIAISSHRMFCWPVMGRGSSISGYPVPWTRHGSRLAGRVIGSPGFMSPEQAEGREVGPPSDIFSLGAVLAFAATGEEPFGVRDHHRVALPRRLRLTGPPAACQRRSGRWSSAAWPKIRISGPPPTRCWPKRVPCSPRPAGCPGCVRPARPAGSARRARGQAVRPHRRPPGRRWWRPLTAAGVTAGVPGGVRSRSASPWAARPGTRPPRSLAPRAAVDARTAAPRLAHAPAASRVPGNACLSRPRNRHRPSSPRWSRSPRLATFLRPRYSPSATATATKLPSNRLAWPSPLPPRSVWASPTRVGVPDRPRPVEVSTDTDTFNAADRPARATYRQGTDGSTSTFNPPIRARMPRASVSWALMALAGWSRPIPSSALVAASSGRIASPIRSTWNAALLSSMEPKSRPGSTTRRRPSQPVVIYLAC